MSTTQIKATIDRMSEANRLFAIAYLKHLSRVDDVTHRKKLGARLRRMANGKKVGLDWLKRWHKELAAAGL